MVAERVVLAGVVPYHIDTNMPKASIAQLKCLNTHSNITQMRTSTVRQFLDDDGI